MAQASMSPMPRMLMRWVGGKNRYVDKIDEVLPDSIHGYYEPFLGGGSILIHVLESGKLAPGAVVRANDANRHLIAFFKAVKENPDNLISELRALDPSKDLFYGYRNEFNAKSATPDKTAALFLYLNKVGFRGLYRTNKSGGFNVPYGTNSFEKWSPTCSRPFFFESEIRKCSSLFNKYNVEFTDGDYRQFLDTHRATMPDASTIVSDPPYVPISENSFQGYTADGFSPKASKDVIDMMHDLSAAGHHVIYFNHDDAYVRERFEGWHVDPYTTRRSISPTDASATAEEVMIYRSNMVAKHPRDIAHN